MTTLAEQGTEIIDIAVIGAAHVIVGDGDMDCDPTPHLRIKKLRKYMGKQDDLAVVAACTAAHVAEYHSPGRVNGIARDRIGLYMGVGYIPFEERELLRLRAAAENDGQFSMQQLSTTGFHAVNGLLTFRCLPNMPAFHISTNLDIQGPCYVTYPGAGQFYTALQQACYELKDRKVDVAMVTGVADQRNYLVRHHFNRLSHPPTTPLVDAAGCIVLQRRKTATTTQVPIAIWKQLSIQYESFDPFSGEFDPAESTCCDGHAQEIRQAMGPASLPILLSQTIAKKSASVFEHRLASRDGIRAFSRWEIL